MRFVIVLLLLLQSVSLPGPGTAHTSGSVQIASDDFSDCGATTDMHNCPNWTVTVLDFSAQFASPVYISSIESGTATYNMAYWNADAFSNNQYSQVIVKNMSPASYMGPSVRVQDRLNGYNCIYGNTGNPFYLQKTIAGVGTDLGSSPVAITINNDDVVEARASGTTISCWVNGVQQITATDSTYASGHAGLGGFGFLSTGAALWKAGNL